MHETSERWLQNITSVIKDHGASFHNINGETHSFSFLFIYKSYMFIRRRHLIPFLSTVSISLSTILFWTILMYENNLDSLQTALEGAAFYGSSVSDESSHKNHYHYHVSRMEKRSKDVNGVRQRIFKDGEDRVIIATKSRRNAVYTIKSTVIQSNHKTMVDQMSVVPKRMSKTQIKNPCIPNLLVIGTQKGGTTSWHVYLKKMYHPNILVPTGAKELDFFNKKYERGATFNDYLTWFPNITKDDHPITGECQFKFNPENNMPLIRAEASPNYMVHPFSAERAHQMLPDTKILVMLRNPINRLVSAYNMKWQEQRCGVYAWRVHNCYKRLINETNTLEMIQKDWQEGLRKTVESEIAILSDCYLKAKGGRITTLYESTITDCLKLREMDSVDLWHHTEDHSHVYRSVYVDQLYKWFKHYPKEAFMIWSSEEFELEPESHMRKMVLWLGLSDNDIQKEKIEGKHHKRSYVAEIPTDLKAKLDSFFAEHNNNLFSLLKSKGFHKEVEILQKHF
jgi:hypothetical protein